MVITYRDAGLLLIFASLPGFSETVTAVTSPQRCPGHTRHLFSVHTGNGWMAPCRCRAIRVPHVGWCIWVTPDHPHRARPRRV